MSTGSDSVPHSPRHAHDRSGGHLTHHGPRPKARRGQPRRSGDRRGRQRPCLKHVTIAFSSVDPYDKCLTPQPSLKRIAAGHNTLQGSKLSTFYGFCGIEDGDEFLSIPVPPTAPTVSTLAVCNL